MNLPYMRFLSLLLFALTAINPGFASVTVADEGAWCWFADPRALHHSTSDGRINNTYLGYIDTHGNVVATQYDFKRRQKKDILIRSYFQPDDHNNPTFLVLPDQRVMVFYSRHTDEPCFYYRISQIPGDLSTLGAEHKIMTADNTTYPSPFILSDDPDHFYLCWRGINWHPTIARLSLPDKNEDVSIVWGPYQIVQSSGARPYAKYFSDGKNRIGLAYTTGHPDNEEPNYLYYNYIDINTGMLCDVTGKAVHRISDSPLQVDKTQKFVTDHSDMVVDASRKRDWVWQLSVDKSGNPLIAMTRISGDKKSHNYYLARWSGKEWKKQFIAHGGSHFHQSPDIEKCYSAGMAIDGDNSDVIYCSVPVSGEHGKVYEIQRYILDGDGEVKNVEFVTSNSLKNNVRPYSIANTQDSPLKLGWMSGDYYDWIVSRERPNGYCTAINVDFNGFEPESYGRKYNEKVYCNKRFKLSDADSKGELCKFDNMVYGVDKTTNKPYVKLKGRKYYSTNVLATSDTWRNQERSTNGKWYDAQPLEEFDLKIVSSASRLETYINGLLDQSIDMPSNTATTAFVVEKPDYKLSPYSGLTRKHWIQAAEYLLSGAFSYIYDLDDPMYFPKQLDKTYPRNEGAVQVAKLEGMARTFFIAAPLLRENPNLTLNGVKVADYYHHQILNLVDPKSVDFVPFKPNGPTQTLLELGSVAMSLQIAKDVVWDSFSKEEKDKLAALFKSYGEGPTIGSNWRFFNVFLLSFLKEHGYEINDDYLKKNLEGLLTMYRGEGWYNDAPAYDYYSMWAYQTYGPLWAHLFGNRQYPEIAAQFTANQSDMLDNYPYMFARDGRMNMWGRSIPYRFACVAPFGMVEFGNRQNVNYGWLRHISSASLLQFMKNPEFIEDGIPTMGFYGPFAPAVQIYSCRGSVFWLGKAFFNLLLPEDSQYWSAMENLGPWESELMSGKVYNKLQPATNLLITNYPNCGGSEMRSWCHETVANDWQKFRSSENYNKLAYHTEFPWMADGKNGVVSMNYATLNRHGDWEVLRLYEFLGFDDGIYRRKAVLETDTCVKYQLAEIPLPDGVLRIDKVNTAVPTEVRLGSYSLADLDNGFKTNLIGDAHVMGNGQYNLAVMPLYGWDDTYEEYPVGLHPVSDRCGVIMNSAKVDGSKIFVTLQLWNKKKIDGKFLSLVESVEVKDDSTVTVRMTDGTLKTVTFE